MGEDRQIRRVEQRVVGRQRLRASSRRARRRRSGLARAPRAAQSWSTRSPRAALIRKAVGFITASSAAPISPRVSSVSGACRETKSASASSGAELVAAAGLQHAHAEPLGPPRHGRADRAVADDQDRRAADVGAEPARPAPTSATRRPAQPPPPRRCRRAHGEQQGKGQIRRGLGQHPGRVPDRDPAPGALVEVDVVGADGHVRDRADRRAGVEQFGIDALGQQAEQTLGVRGERPQLLRESAAAPPRGPGLHGPPRAATAPAPRAAGG